MARTHTINRYQEVDGEVVMNEGKPVWEVVTIPFTVEEEAAADAKQADILQRQADKRAEDAQKAREQEALRVSLGLTEAQFDLIKNS